MRGFGEAAFTLGSETKETPKVSDPIAPRAEIGHKGRLFGLTLPCVGRYTKLKSSTLVVVVVWGLWSCGVEFCYGGNEGLLLGCGFSFTTLALLQAPLLDPPHRDLTIKKSGGFHPFEEYMYIAVTIFISEENSTTHVVAKLLIVVICVPWV